MTCQQQAINMAHYSGCEVCQMLAFTSTLACVTCYNNTCLGRPITDPNELNFNNVLSTSERFLSTKYQVLHLSLLHFPYWQYCVNYGPALSYTNCRQTKNACCVE